MGQVTQNGDLYIATVSEILKLTNIESRLTHPPAPEIVYNKFPKDEHHGWKFIAFGPDEKLYVPVGAPCNICEKKSNNYWFDFMCIEYIGFVQFSTSMDNRLKTAANSSL